ncbi:uncharacterized protein LOC131028261 isoform X2 [Cryptomeria japonica]|uniref:uncharacterized protein LOC131028261 isoform X2 n=1 Tax=Cryptomeria japonica TaxID=3369 RepID=UPI0027DA2ECD|nr:uncharacterized protein LOC131028261 isoform X2 [Cryptomeria japonica]
MSGEGARRNAAGGGAAGRPVLCPAGNRTPKNSPAKQGTKQQQEKAALKLSSLSPKHPSSAPGSPELKHRLAKPGSGTSSPNVMSGYKLGKIGRSHVKNGEGCISPGSSIGRSPECCNAANNLLNRAGGSLNVSSCSCPIADSSCTSKKLKQRILLRSSKQNGGVALHDSIPRSLPPPVKNRCPWITSFSDPAYVTFHDNEWGVPVHDDKCFSRAELVFHSESKGLLQVFAGFDPAVVATFDDKKIASLMYIENSVLYEGKLLGIVNNAKLVLEIVEEFGSLDTYMWSFVGHKPIINRYRYPRQVPVRIPKAEVISRDLLRRGFRFVGPMVVYSFMQVAGMTNDHLVHCFRWEECVWISKGLQVGQYNKIQTEEVCENKREGILPNSYDKESIANSHQDL